LPVGTLLGIQQAKPSKWAETQLALVKSAAIACTKSEEEPLISRLIVPLTVGEGTPRGGRKAVISRSRG